MERTQGVTPSGRAVSRVWRGRTTLEVFAVHPQVGELYRGTVRMVAGAGDPAARCRWELSNYDSLPLEVVAGDYLDAEARLIARTAELDVLLSAEEAARMGVEDQDPWLIY